MGLEPSVVIALATAFLFFIASGLIAFLNVQSLRAGNQRIVQTHMAIVAMDELLSAVQDAETGQRGFLLTGDERYLAPYESALRSIPRRLDDIADKRTAVAAQGGRLAALREHVAAKLAELAQTIALRRSGDVAGAMAIVSSDRGKAGMDMIRTGIAAMAQEEGRVRVQRLEEMEGAQQRAVWSALLSTLVGLLLTGVITWLLRGAALTRRREEWLQTGEVGLAAATMGNQSTEAMNANILDFLVAYTGAVAGAMFVREGERYVRAGSHGVQSDDSIPAAFGVRDGLLGQAAADGKANIVDDVPDGYLAFGSALGAGKPRHLAILPCKVEDDVNAVLEIGFLQRVEPWVMALLPRASTVIASAVQAAAYRRDLQGMLEETQRQSEELQTQSEELRVSNEELEEQSRALEASKLRLEQQQFELEQTNVQLEEQAQQLELQKDDLEHANARVEQRARELELASQYKSDFLANMSHELRTPLNSSLILAKLLADNPDDNLTDEQVTYARTIQSSGNDLLGLINDILDLAKIEAGHVDIRPEIVGVQRIADNLAYLFRPLATDKQLQFAVRIAGNAPQRIETDPQRLEQVLKNLLSNAFKFTAAGSVTLTIDASNATSISFAVSDTGIGIAKEQQEQVFEAFHQADGAISRNYGGTGLGLSISRQLVRLLGGALEMRSEPGKGSTFTVRLPVSHDANSALNSDNASHQAVNQVLLTQGELEQGLMEHVTTPAPPVSAGLRPLPKLDDDREALTDSKRVLLVVEDDTTFASIVRDLSREMGFQAIVAGTAGEALELARSLRPHAIVLDVGLPDQSGLSVLDRLKDDFETRHIPIHVVSADDHTEAAYTMGALGFAAKPVTREQMVDVLQKLEKRLSQNLNRVLVVEDDPVQRDAIARLLGSRDVETFTAGTAAECLSLLRNHTFDCMVLDLTLPDASGYTLLETLSQETSYAFPPVIVYTGRVLSPDDEQRLRRYSKSIIIKGAKSPERLLDEVSLFLHQVVSELPQEHQKMIRKARHRDALLEGRRILVVEDDVRNVYALTNILEPRGAVVQIARNGKEALELLQTTQGLPETHIDLVLMDVMMPVMDGLTATREIRNNPEWRKLPIITLTAKAMPDDQKRCIEAGANDYMAKPLDVDKLLSLVRVWMPK